MLQATSAGTGQHILSLFPRRASHQAIFPIRLGRRHDRHSFP